MNNEEFRKYGHELIDWIADYSVNMGDYPVLSQVQPGEIYNKLPEIFPDEGENFDVILNDFKNLIIPGITHWQSPDFFGYFPANNSNPSILAEILTSAIGAQCMMWQTSPAAAELEEKTMNWLRQAIGLPDYFSGVIQDTASTATLVSLLTAREVRTNFSINRDGFDKERFRVYCSAEAHSSIEKDVKIAGIGKNNLVKIQVDNNFSMIPEEFEKAVINDLNKGYLPLCVIAAFGTTGSTAIDPLRKIGEIARKNNIWYHIDAAYAGSAMILPELRYLMDGSELCDTFVFNPHKWLFTNFDLSAYFVKDTEALIKTFEIMPEYLKTNVDNHVNNYRDWGIQLGRRFRALKLWFVIRSYGMNGLREKIRFHISLAKTAYKWINENPDFEILAPMPFNTICFRYNPGNKTDEFLNRINAEIIFHLNKTGKVFFTHTKLNGKYTIRWVIAQTNVEEKNITDAWKLILETTKKLEVKYV